MNPVVLVLVIQFLQQYGWFMLFGVILLFVIKQRLMHYLATRPSRRSAEEQDLHRYGKLLSLYMWLTYLFTCQLLEILWTWLLSNSCKYLLLLLFIIFFSRFWNRVAEAGGFWSISSQASREDGCWLSTFCRRTEKGEHSGLDKIIWLTDCSYRWRSHLLHFIIFHIISWCTFSYSIQIMI